MSVLPLRYQRSSLQFVLPRLILRTVSEHNWCEMRQLWNGVRKASPGYSSDRTERIAVHGHAHRPRLSAMSIRPDLSRTCTGRGNCLDRFSTQKAEAHHERNRSSLRVRRAWVGRSRHGCVSVPTASRSASRVPEAVPGDRYGCNTMQDLFRDRIGTGHAP